MTCFPNRPQPLPPPSSEQIKPVGWYCMIGPLVQLNSPETEPDSDRCLCHYLIHSSTSHSEMHIKWDKSNFLTCGNAALELRQRKLRVRRAGIFYWTVTRWSRHWAGTYSRLNNWDGIRHNNKLKNSPVALNCDNTFKLNPCFWNLTTLFSESLKSSHYTYRNALLWCDIIATTAGLLMYTLYVSKYW